MGTRMSGFLWKWAGVTFELAGEYYPGRQGRFTGHPDTWEPAEPGEFVIDSARIGDVDALDFLESVYTRRGESLYDLAAKEIVDRIELGDWGDWGG